MSTKEIAFVLFGCFQTQGMDDQQFGQSSKTHLDKSAVTNGISGEDMICLHLSRTEKCRLQRYTLL